MKYLKIYAKQDSFKGCTKDKNINDLFFKPASMRKRGKLQHHQNATWDKLLTERLELKMKSVITLCVHIYMLVTT